MEHDRIKRLRLIPLLFLLPSLLLVIQMSAKTHSAYEGHHSIERDKTDDLLLRCAPLPDWKKLDKGGFSISREQMEYVGGSKVTVPLYAELERQCFDNSGEEKAPFDTKYTYNSFSSLIYTYAGKTEDDADFLTYNEKHILFEKGVPADSAEKAEKAGLELVTEPIAYDGLVFFTHRDNPVESLTLKQIQDIYSGKITNWKDVGGNDEKIVAYQRSEGSEEQWTMDTKVMGFVKMTEPEESYMEGSTRFVGEYVNKVNSLGYTSGACFQRLYASEDIKKLKIDGTEPSEDTFRSGAYPIVDTYYVITVRGDDSISQDLRRYILSDRGQQLVRMAGLCPVKEVR